MGMAMVMGGLLQAQAQNQTQAQTRGQSQNLLPYVNYENSMFLLYPPDWTVSDAGLTHPDFAVFYSPLENLSDFTPPAQVTLSLQRYQQNISLANYTNQTLTALYNTALQMSQQANQTQPPISVRSSDLVTVAGYPGHRVNYIVSSPPELGNQSSVSVIQLWTLVDSNKLYTITYAAENYKFLAYLPDAGQIINSLRIANSTSIT
jgi:hypothetical protein